MAPSEAVYDTSMAPPGAVYEGRPIRWSGPDLPVRPGPYPTKGKGKGKGKGKQGKQSGDESGDVDESDDECTDWGNVLTQSQYAFRRKRMIQRIQRFWRRYAVRRAEERLAQMEEERRAVRRRREEADARRLAEELSDSDNSDEFNCDPSDEDSDNTEEFNLKISVYVPDWWPQRKRLETEIV